MASATPTRRVLGSLDVNTPTSRGSLQPSKLSAESPTKPASVGEVYIQTEPREVMPGEVREDDSLGRNKRDGDFPDNASPKSAKRHKRVGPSKNSLQEGFEDTQDGQASHGCEDSARVLGSPRSRQILDFDAHSPSSSSASPSSSIGSGQLGLDDSQNTLLTEPDDVPLPIALFVPTPSPAASVPLTKEEIREKAQALKLRLRLAQYKVRTNQMDVPLSQLQVRTLGSTGPSLPYIPRLSQNTSFSSNTSAENAQTTQPTLPTSSLHQRVSGVTQPTLPAHVPQRRPSAAMNSYTTTQQGGKTLPLTRLDRIPSSPPPYLPLRKEQANLVSPVKAQEEIEDFATPLAPRQRQGMLQGSNLRSPIRNELTSSVVKGRAADGLLSLKRQQN